ncbi:MAG TPA: HAD-IA family hydrolase [Polyangiaceae bacterium]|nr:HAD-IA family hydrolase [Polyangiaceae bacterium]
MSELTSVATDAAVEGVVFDLDGTLVDSRRDIVHAVEVALTSHGVAPPAPNVIATFVGDGARLLVARALALPLDEPRVDPVLETYLAYYEAHPVEHTTLMPGALSALDALDQMPLAVCTNKPRRIADLVLSRLGLTDRFAVVVGGGDTARGKPDPEPLVAASERLGTPAARLAMVGDGVQDVACGRAAGAYTVAVLGGFFDAEALRRARPNVLISNLSELPPLLVARGV